MHSSIKYIMMAGTFALTAISGCKSDDNGPGTTTATTSDPDMAVMTMSGVDVDPTMASLCGIDSNQVFFKYDSAQVTPGAKQQLDAIAACVLTGPASGRDLVVIGRTDPKGTDDYNTQLGMSRADSVAKYLREQGVTNSRVETRSRGEDNATNDPWGWPFERRVTVWLAP